MHGGNTYTITARSAAEKVMRRKPLSMPFLFNLSCSEKE